MPILGVVASAISASKATRPISYLIVGGGGSGGNSGTGGASSSGGSGSQQLAVNDYSYQISVGNPFTITVGAGGSGGNSSTSGTNTNGINSVLGSLTALAGIKGTVYSTPGPSAPDSSGGAGGGPLFAGVTTGGNGGNGTAPYLDGVTRAGGGGSGWWDSGTSTASPGGAGGGGTGGGSISFGTGYSGSAGSANFGAGGGGKGAGSWDGGSGGGNGGSGIVIIRYADSFADIASIAAGLTFTRVQSGGFKTYTFTAGTGLVTI